MPSIALNKGLRTTVGFRDLKKFGGQQWSADGPRTKAEVYYAVGTVAGRKVYLHRAILNAPKGRRVDHKDGDTLNNRRSNLRLCTAVQNGHNRLNAAGVTYDRNRRRWAARVQVEYRTINLGRFKTREEATRVRRLAERKYFGKFAPKK